MIVFCARCGLVDERILYARVERDKCLCRQCWQWLGRPWAGKWNFTADELLAVENAARKGMVGRGGSDRHIVRKGLS